MDGWMQKRRWCSEFVIESLLENKLAKFTGFFNGLATTNLTHGESIYPGKGIL